MCCIVMYACICIYKIISLCWLVRGFCLEDFNCREKKKKRMGKRERERDLFFKKKSVIVVFLYYFILFLLLLCLGMMRFVMYCMM